MDVQSLAVQKGELDSQLSERRGRLAQYKKEEKKVQEKVQNQRDVINKHKAGEIKALVHITPANEQTCSQNVMNVLNLSSAQYIDWAISLLFVVTLGTTPRK